MPPPPPARGNGREEDTSPLANQDGKSIEEDEEEEDEEYEDEDDAAPSSFGSARGDSSPSVKNILLLDSEGKRVAVKYYSDDWPTNAAKLAFEGSVFAKTLKTNARIEAEIMMFDSHVVTYKFVQDLHFFVTGGDDENELILATVLQGFFDAIALLLRMILETDPTVIAGKVATH